MDLSGSIARGGAAAEELQKQTGPKGSRFESVDWFSLEDRETKIYRLIDDFTEWFSVLQHPFAPTRPAPEDWSPEQKQRWPKSMSPVCRRTPQFIQFFADGCYICDHMHEVRPSTTKSKRYYGQVRLWARAVEREEIRVETDKEAEEFGLPKGSIAGYADVLVEVEETDADGNPTGKKSWKPKIVVMNMAIKNFFGALQGYGEAYGTVMDRDYRITRKGTQKDTDYNIVPLDPIEDLDDTRLDVRTSPFRNEDGQPTGETLREYYNRVGPNLIKLIEDRIDDDLYHRFFDDRVPIPERKSESGDGDSGKGGSSNGTTTKGAAASVPDGPAESPAPAADKGATAAKLARLRSRVRGENPPPDSQDEGAESPVGASA